MPVIAVALVVSGVTLGAVAVVAGLAKYCKECDFGKVWGRLTGRLTDDEKLILIRTEYQAAYQVTQNTEIPVNETGQFIQYENLFVKAEQAISAAAQESRLPQPTSAPEVLNHHNADSRDLVDEDAIMRKLVRCYSSESLTSVTSESSVQENLFTSVGQIEVILEYSTEPSRLIVTVVQARDLRPSPEGAALSDTYVTLYLHPDNDVKGQTKIYRRSFNPVYNERFSMRVRWEDLPRRTLRMTVMNYDRHSRHEEIGEAELHLADIEWLHGPFNTWLNLNDAHEKPENLGDIMFSLSYLPTAERLTVVIVKARGLKWIDNKKSGDPFVKVYLLQSGKKISKKKTSTKRSETCPIFNEAMMFSVPSNILEKVTLRITVAESGAGGKIPSVGHVLIGANSRGTALSHWNQMLVSLRKPVAMWHPLRK
ncbi:synaptotagmin-12-like [Diadema antillarum]|uniref:synaptotagmin-12-like n=1 Tax=Diadema antillarum TaxID=105358 RepID=UPI003A839460